MGRTLLVINAAVDETKKAEVAAGRYPRKDYWELQRALDADLLDRNAVESSRWSRLLCRVAGPAVAQALFAAHLCGRYDAVFVDQESVGFALAALLRLRRRRPRLVMIGHLLSPSKKQILFRALHLERVIDTVIVHSSSQYRIALRTLGLQSMQVVLLPYQTDERFWRPHAEIAVKEQICSVGREYRDYPTLIKAVEGLAVNLVIAAASYWSKHEGIEAGDSLPPNVRVDSFLYDDLRRLYAESLFVVVPLHEVENQAGITTILEAMAMGKAVVVSHTRGQTDVVRDRRRSARYDPERVTQPGWARDFGASEATVRGHTGIYVRPGDVTDLRQAITFLLDNPEQARIMGANGRRLVDEVMGLDRFTARIAALLDPHMSSPSSRLHAAPQYPE